MCLYEIRQFEHWTLGFDHGRRLCIKVEHAYLDKLVRLRLRRAINSSVSRSAWAAMSSSCSLTWNCSPHGQSQFHCTLHVLNVLSCCSANNLRVCGNWCRTSSGLLHPTLLLHTPDCHILQGITVSVVVLSDPAIAVKTQNQHKGNTVYWLQILLHAKFGMQQNLWHHLIALRQQTQGRLP